MPFVEENYMKKTRRIFAALILAAFAVAALAGCGGSSGDTTESVETSVSSDSADASAERTSVRIGALKGPTTIGIVNMLQDSYESESNDYEFTLATQADELTSAMVSGDLDIALVPANVASILYTKTDGGISVIDINTLGVLYCITGNTDVKSISDLAGKTVITTGQGTTPEYVLRYLLDKYGVEDVTLDFRSESTEVASVLQEDPNAIAVLPQPFVTVTEAKNDAVSTVFSLSDAWDEVSDGSRMVTGVTIVRNEFLNEHPEAVECFLTDHAASVEMTSSDLDRTAELVVSYEIISSVEIAKKAIPECNIVCITGEEMKTSLSGYLEVLFDQDPASVGGSMPGDSFYYLG